MTIEPRNYFFDTDGEDEPSMWRQSQLRPHEAIQILRRSEHREVFDLLQMLLAFGALREVKAQAWDNCVGWFSQALATRARTIDVVNDAEAANPYRDTDVEAGDE